MDPNSRSFLPRKTRTLFFGNHFTFFWLRRPRRAPLRHLDRLLPFPLAHFTPDLLHRSSVILLCSQGVTLRVPPAQCRVPAPLPPEFLHGQPTAVPAPRFFTGMAETLNPPIQPNAL